MHAVGVQLYELSGQPNSNRYCVFYLGASGGHRNQKRRYTDATLTMQKLSRISNRDNTRMNIAAYRVLPVNNRKQFLSIVRR